MGRICGCGSTTTLQELHCVKCDARCCPSCVLTLGSATYCGRCADSVLDAEGAPPGLSAPAAGIWPRSTRPEADNERQRTQWLVLVARDQPDLFTHLVRAFARDDKVEIIMDRRKDYSRNPPGMKDRLRTNGATIIKRRP